MTKPIRHSHCSYCGHPWLPNAPWPRTCAGCGTTSWVNPLPVAVVLQPIGAGVVAIRRSIPPRKGELALPGGFINLGESWQEAAARELLEETGIRQDPATVEELLVLSSDDGHLLVFCRAPALPELPPLAANEEVSEMVLLTSPVELCFPTHTRALHEYFRRHGNC
jgi:ADP-ribose pyrophosphatase YjhB (NUDIX family)